MRRPLVVLAASALLFGCPGALDHPERFLDGGADGGTDGGMDAGCGDVEKTIFALSCGGAGSCHESPNPQSNLDLIAPDAGGRIRSATSTCMAKPMSVMILERVKPNPSCGNSIMPLGGTPLTPGEYACLEAYIKNLNSDGGL